MKRFLVLAGLLLLAAPAVYAAPPAGKGKPETSASSSSSQSPAKACKQELKSMGAVEFRSKYGNFGKCVKQQKQKQKDAKNQNVQDAEKNAAKACKAERAKDPEAFATKYGTNANNRNAFGKCVSGKAKEETEEEQEATLNAAKACKKERGDMGATAFAERYGTNANKKKAFGKCVSGKAKENGESDDD
jgi:hypothetical protein